MVMLKRNSYYRYSQWGLLPEQTFFNGKYCNIKGVNKEFKLKKYIITLLLSKNASIYHLMDFSEGDWRYVEIKWRRWM